MTVECCGPAAMTADLKYFSAIRLAVLAVRVLSVATNRLARCRTVNSFIERIFQDSKVQWVERVFNPFVGFASASKARAKP
jgi:hypothetical protein